MKTSNDCDESINEYGKWIFPFGRIFMKYFDKKISEIEFYGIKYRKIEDINDYSLLKKEIDDLLENGDKTQWLIKAENRKNEAEYEKEKSMSINLGLAESLLFGIYGYVCGCYFGKTEERFINILLYLLSVGIAIFFVWILIMRADVILNVRSRKVIFYDTIYRIMTNSLHSKNV